MRWWLAQAPPACFGTHGCLLSPPPKIIPATHLYLRSHRRYTFIYSCCPIHLHNCLEQCGFLIRHLRQAPSFRARILSPTSPRRPRQTSFFPSFRLTLVLVDFGPPWQQAFRILWVMDKTSDSQSPLLRFILALQTTCMTARPLPLRSLS
jgi:hypothetical protein